MRRLAVVLACSAACAPPAPPVCAVGGRCPDEPNVEVARSRPQAALLPDGPPVCAVSGRWSDGPYFEVARGSHQAALLPDGRIMVVGGSINVHANDDAGMEVVGFDGTLTRYNKAPRRIGHSVTRLLDGRVLIIGGTGAEAPHDSQPTFLYDARRDAWTFPRALVNAPVYHTATLLEDGRLLLVGGRYNGFPVSPVEKEVRLFDAARDRHRTLAPLHHARADHTATLLGDGRVLVVGGWGKPGLLGHAELFDPKRNHWREIPGATPRASHTATRLRDGRVLLVGGGQGGPSAQLFDPQQLTFEEVPPLVPDREDHTATLVGGAVLVAGGYVQDHGATAETALFDAASHSWCRAASMSQARMAHTATRLDEGRVLVAGGSDEASGERTMDPFNRTTEIFRIGVP